ncbi:MAG: hypothetical protein SGILL_005555, partial [Bacillariaceae sp.]
MTFMTENMGGRSFEFQAQVSQEFRQRRASQASSRALRHSEVLESIEYGNATKSTNEMKYIDETNPDSSLKVGGSEDIVNIDNGEGEQAKPEELNPWSKGLIGIPVTYFSVGIVYAGSVSILYPVLVIQHGVDTNFFTAATSLVTLFWSYKIFFGLLCDTLPIFGRRWKPYIIMGWLLCAAMLVALASMGEDVSPTTLVIMLTLANLGYLMADVAADGFMVWIAHHESESKRGRIQTLIYIIREIGRICINVVIIVGFSGPHVNCPGYESDPNVPCTTDETVMNRNDLSEQFPDTWCYMTCDDAQFDFGMTIPQYAWLIAGVNLLSVPAYFLLEEERKDRAKATKVLADFWQVAKKRANQILNIMESVFFAVGLTLVRKYALDFSWRKMIWIGTFMVNFFNLLYLLIVFDILRNPWFYIFTDVSDTFMITLNFLAGVFAIVEVSEPGFESITYSLVTTCNNATIPLSIVISYQLMAFFPDLNTQEGLAQDTPEVRRQFAYLILIVEAVNFTSLLSLPMLPRQREETRELVAKGETSAFWAKFTIISAAVFLIYSTIITFFTVAGAEQYGCLKIL